MRRLWNLRKVLVLFATTTFIATASAVAPPAEASDTVTLNFVMTNCSKCTVYAYNNMTNFAAHVKLRKGKGKLRVLKSATQGMHFTFVSPDSWNGHPNAVSLAALQYDGVKAGKKISTKSALRQKYASACWAGTNKSSTTIKFVRYKFRMPITDDPYGVFGNGQYSSFWASPQLRSLPQVVTAKAERGTLKGGLHTQQQIWCVLPS